MSSFDEFDAFERAAKVSLAAQAMAARPARYLDELNPAQREAAETIEESTASTAIFYSISNCQAGLKGIALGDLLIKQVAELIVAELPGIKTFATLVITK